MTISCMARRMSENGKEMLVGVVFGCGGLKGRGLRERKFVRIVLHARTGFNVLENFIKNLALRNPRIFAIRDR